MVLTASFELSLVIGRSCHHRLADTSERLDASVEASGPHDFAVRFARVRLHRQSVHRIPRPTFVTIAKRPSCGHGTLRILPVIWGRDQLRQIGTTGKSPARAEMLSSDEQLLRLRYCEEARRMG
jgi:hypothetical protein